MVLEMSLDFSNINFRYKLKDTNLRKYNPGNAKNTGKNMKMQIIPKLGMVTIVKGNDDSKELSQRSFETLFAFR